MCALWWEGYKTESMDEWAQIELKVLWSFYVAFQYGT